MALRRRTEERPPPPPESCAFCGQRPSAWEADTRLVTYVIDTGKAQHASRACMTCYETRRLLSPIERAILARRTDVPPRHTGEQARDYLARAIRASRLET